MPTPQEKLDAMLDAYQAAHKTPATDPGKQLRELIEKTPGLKATFLEQIDKGRLDGFTPLATPSALETYNPYSKKMAVSGQFNAAANSNTNSGGIRVMRNFNAAFSVLASSLLLCALAACAGTAPLPSPSVKEKPAMSTESLPPSPPTPHTAQEVTQRLLALIGDVHSVKDISPGIIQKHFGPLGWNNPNQYGVNGKLIDAWYYSLRSMSEPPSEKSRGLLFEFVDNTHANADMSPVCVPLENFKQPLTAAGFTAERRRNRHDTQDYWEFSRDNIGVTVYLRGKSRPLEETQTCVSAVIISALS